MLAGTDLAPGGFLSLAEALKFNTTVATLELFGAGRLIRVAHRLVAAICSALGCWAPARVEDLFAALGPSMAGLLLRSSVVRCLASFIKSVRLRLSNEGIARVCLS
eukprot:6192473-Pleurochrysis_carterae.AAC.3